MNEEVRVAISKLICWYDASRIQTWPSMLASANPGDNYASVTEFGRLCGSDRMSDAEHLADHDYVRNLPGLEVRSGRPVLRGVGLLEKMDNGYRLSEQGRHMGRIYRDAPKSKEWVRYLAQVFLTREPRTRVLVRALSRPTAELVFKRSGWFAGPLQESKIVLDGRDAIRPFGARQSSLPNLADLLAEEPDWALGEWRQNPLIATAPALTLTGYKSTAISLDRIGQALKAPFEVLLHLGLISNVDGRCRFDTVGAAEQLGEHLASDFGWPSSTQTRAHLSLPTLLARIVDEIVSDNGYVVAAELRQRLNKEGIENPDREIARLEDNGRVVIDAFSHGQSRHGKGLYGQDAYQLIKIKVLEGM